MNGGLGRERERASRQATAQAEAGREGKLVGRDGVVGAEDWEAAATAMARA